jgi:sec-independent protein translocase protein TatC
MLPDAPSDEPKALHTHLVELRNRLVKVALCFVGFFGVGYAFSQKIQHFFIRPLSPILKQGRSLVYTSLPEAFFSEINVTIFASLLLTLPFFLIQAWLFLRPGLFRNERRILRGVMICIPVLFFIGVAFAQLVVLPRAFSFFISFEHKEIPLYFLPKLSDYISFSQQLMVVFGLGFELPVVLFTLVSFGMLSLQSLKSRWRMVIFILCAISAVITPPDALSMMALAIPMIALYGVTILVIQCTQPKIKNHKDPYYA